MDVTAYGDFSKRMHRHVMAARAPAQGAIELTRRCPLACVHCYNNLPLDDPDALDGEISTGEWRRILDELAEAGCLWLLFTGGEILARSDFLDIYMHAKRRGFIITLFTNGVRMTPHIADLLAEYRPFSVEITIYGATPETYEKVTRVPGSFDRSMRGIRLLVERGLSVKLKTMLLRTNKHELLAMKRLAREELGVGFRFDAIVNCRIDCSRAPLEVRLSPEEVMDLEFSDPQRVAELREFVEEHMDPEADTETTDELYDCGAGRTAFSIDPCGRLRLCELSNHIAYDLRQGSFREGWEGELLRVRQTRISRATKCHACQIKVVCDMCPAHAELENRDPEEPVEFMCRVAHLRAGRLGLPVPEHGKCEYCDCNEEEDGKFAAAGGM